MHPDLNILAPAPRRNIPVRVLRAIDAAGRVIGLKRGPCALLAEICRFVAQDRPFETVFAYKSTLAERAAMSERSIYRHLNVLAEFNLIEILEQERKSRNGRFAVARVRLTRKAAALVGLTECEAETFAESKVIHTSPSANLTARHTLTEPTISKNQPPQRTENGLPIDLTSLTGQGLSRAGIFKLMGLAKAHGKLLSDIVIAVRERIASIKGGRLYAYLAKLAAGPSDFAVTAAAARCQAEQDRQARQDTMQERSFRQRFGGVTLANRAQTELYVIDRACQFVQVMGKRTGSAPLRDVREWIAGINSGRLVLATRDAELKLGM